MSKKDLEVRTWPEDVPFQFDTERWSNIVERCQRACDALYKEGIPQSKGEIPFPKPTRTSLTAPNWTSGGSSPSLQCVALMKDHDFSHVNRGDE